MNISPLKEEEEESSSNHDRSNDCSTGSTGTYDLENIRQQQQQELQQGNISNEALGASVADEQLEQYRSQLLRALLTARSPGTASLSRQPVRNSGGGGAVGESISVFDSTSDQLRTASSLEAAASSSCSTTGSSSARRGKQPSAPTAGTMIADATFMPCWPAFGVGIGAISDMMPQSLSSSAATLQPTSGNNETPLPSSMYFSAHHQQQLQHNHEEESSSSTNEEGSFVSSLASPPFHHSYYGGQHFFNQFHTQPAHTHASNDSPRVPGFEKAGAQTLYSKGGRNVDSGGSKKNPLLLPTVHPDLNASKVPAISASASWPGTGADRDSEDEAHTMDRSPFVFKKREPLPRSKEEEALLEVQRKFLEQLLKQDQENRGSRRRRSGSAADDAEGKEAEVRPPPRRRKPAYDVSVERNVDGDHEIVWTKRTTKTTAPRKRRKKTSTTTGNEEGTGADNSNGTAPAEATAETPAQEPPDGDDDDTVLRSTGMARPRPTGMARAA